MTPATLREAAALIESLTAERDALAEQVRAMREALEAAAVQVPEFLDYIGPRGHSDVQQTTNPTSNLISSALALAPTAAEQRAKANAEKAALIESLESERDALAEQVRLMREALEESKVHVAYVADRDTNRHQVSWEASGALRLLEVALALAPNAAEQRAKENAEAAAQVPGLVEQLRIKGKAIEDVLDLIQNSEGVAGLHLNGDEAPWSSLRKGGQFEEWLRSLDVAVNLDVSEAEQRAKENAEKAAKWDEFDWQAVKDAAVTGLLAYCKRSNRYMSIEVQDAIFDGIEALRAVHAPTAAEQRARENAEKAAEYDATRSVMSGLFADKPLQDAVAMRISELVFGLDLSSPSGEKVRQYDATRKVLAGNFAEFPLDVAVSHLYMKAVQRAESAEAAAQVPGLVEQLRLMREAVKSACEFIEATHKQLNGSLLKAQAMGICAQLSEAYHADATEAEQRAKENAEAAALLDWATTRMETHNEYVFPVFGPTSQDPDCRFAWFRYDRNGLAYETAYDALRAAKEASDGN